LADAAPYVHHSSSVDDGAEIGRNTRIWHFCHVSGEAKIGRDCSLGQNVFVADHVVIGDGVKIQNNVSIYSGVELEDYVFCGPSCVFTNVKTPRSDFPRRDVYERTLVKRGATLGANTTIVCGVTIGQYSFIAAGSVLTRDAPDYALMVGVPARRVGWAGRHGYRLKDVGNGKWVCPETEWVYQASNDQMRCLSWPEEKPLVESGR